MTRPTGPETEVPLPSCRPQPRLVAMIVRRSRYLAATLMLGLALMIAYASPVGAVQLGAAVMHHGACDPGPSHWKLRVLPDPEDAGLLIVRFALTGGTPGDTWNLFLDQNGTGFFAGSRVSGDLGFVRVGRRTPDAAGHDIIRAAGHDVTTGEICRGRVRI
jgi:hypothetical protein